MSTMRYGLILVLAVCCSACGLYENRPSGFLLPAPTFNMYIEPKTINPAEPTARDVLAADMDNKRALFIGEIHDNLAHHQNQLQVIQGLYARHPDMAIGMEYFQQPFQRYLDDYVAGRIDEKTMLNKTEYYKRWKIDYRMLRPIFEFAREKHIPLLALNVSEEIHNKVFKHGLESLTSEERIQIPAQIKPANPNYLQRLKAIFDSHPQAASFPYFVDGVLLWDEAMAESAANYLSQHPQSRIVVLAGLVHIMYGDGIPERVNHRLGSKQSLVTLNGNDFAEFSNIADYVLTTTTPTALPGAGKLGVTLIDDADSMHVSNFASVSPAKTAGVMLNDRIVSLDGIAVANIAELKTVMLDKQPGTQVQISVLREITQGRDLALQFSVELN